MFTPYFIIEVLMMFCALRAYKHTKVINKRYFIFICVLWALVFGLRGYNVGNDTPGYVDFFMDRNPYVGYGAVTKGSDMEPGFVYISRVVKFFFDSPTMWFLTLSSWLFLLIYKFYIKYCGPYNCFLSLLTFFIIGNPFVTLMVASRQSTAFCVLLTGLYMILSYYRHDYGIRWNLTKNRRFTLGSLIFLSSVLVHKSILILIAILAVARFVRLNKIVMYGMIGASFVISFLWSQDIGNLFNMFFMTVGEIADSDSVRADVMASYADDFGGNVQNLITLFAWAGPVCLTIFLSDKEQINSFFFKVLVFAVCIFLLFNTTFLIERINTLLILLGFIAYLPHKAFHKPKWRFVYSIFVIMMLVKAMMRYNNWPTTDTCIPYHFFWQ